MSLVGSHIEVHSTTTTSISVSSPYSEAATPRNAPGTNVEDLHPPISPKSSSEEYFLGGNIDTQSVSATVLAEQLYLTSKRSATKSMANTEDYVTALDQEDFMTANADPLSFHFSHFDALDSPYHDKDALAFSRSFESQSSSPEFHESNMSSTAPDRTSYELNPAEKVYLTAKDVWGWGKTVRVFSPFMGIAEGVAGKMVSVVGSNLSDIDGAVTSNLTKVDDNILNPAIDALVKIVFNAMQKTEDIVKPVIMAVLKPIGLVKNKAETPELTTSYKSAVTPS